MRYVDIDAAQTSTTGHGWHVTKSRPWKYITLNGDAANWWIELKENGEIRSSLPPYNDPDEAKAFFDAMAKVQEARAVTVAEVTV